MVIGQWRGKVDIKTLSSLIFLAGYAKPFIVNVRTNAVEGSGSPADTNNRGFCLNYVQQPCTANG